MPDAEQTVFISYRRNVSRHLARAIFMDLRQNGYDAFLDVDTIDSGQFDRIILNQIAARAHFLVLLSKGTLLRCIEPGDWLRLEIEHAMKLQRNIVPVIEEGFSFEEEKQYLLGDLSVLPSYSALRLFHDYFDEGMEKLRNRFLKQPVYGVITPTPLVEQEIVQQKIAKAATIDTVVVPARSEGFNRVFLGQHCWYEVRIHETMRPLIKFVAAYQVAPVSKITHVAPVKSIESWRDTGKVVIHFSEPAKEIGPIALVKKGRVKPLYNLRYTTLERLKSAKTLDEVW